MSTSLHKFQQLKIGDVCIVNPRKDISHVSADFISFVPMESASTDGQIDTSKKISLEKTKNYTLFKEGDILFAKITPCMENGKGGIAKGLLNGYGAGSTEFIVLRPDSSILSNKWLSLFLSQKSFRHECLSHTKGSAGQKRVPPSYIANCSIPIPSTGEQERIISKIEELFSEIDNAIASLETVKQKLEIYRQAVYTSAFASFHDCVPLTEYFDISSGITKNPDRSKLKMQMPYLRVANVYYNKLDLSEIKKIGVEENEIAKNLLKSGDLLFVEGNGSKSQIGRVAIWDGSIPDCLHQNHIIKARVQREISVRFVLYYLMSEHGRKQILKVATSSSGLYTLSANKIRNIKIPFCPIEEQQRAVSLIEEKLSSCDMIANTISQVLQQAKALKQIVLKSAFEGTLL